MVQDVIEFSKFLSAGAIVLSFVIGIWRLFKKLDNKKKTLEYNTITVLKLVITNEHLPLDERVAAGEKYISLGGNGSIKKLVNKLSDELAKEYLE